MAIVVSHIADRFDTLARQALRQAPLADVVELRLDRIGNPGEEQLAAFVKQLGKPVIVTLHGDEAFGDFRGDVDERLDILHSAARAGVTFVDCDYRLSLDLGEMEGKCHRIVSRHELEGTPDDLEGALEEVRDQLYEGDLIKFVGHASDAVEGLRLLNFVRQVGGGLIGFSSGEAGSFTRVLAPIYGSPFTYAAPAEIPGEPLPEPTAPGQLRVNDLRGLYPPGGLSPETAIFAVCGDRARASWSPRVHGMGYKAAQLDAIYVAFECTDFAALMEQATDENLRGLSITAPFKEVAVGFAHTRDAFTETAGACNTLVRDPRGWRAANTDGPAIRNVMTQAFAQHARKSGTPAGLDRARTLVLGAGGAARAVGTVVRQAGGELVCAARRIEAARELCRSVGGGQAIEWSAIELCEYDVLVNTTPVGSFARDAGSELPITDAALRPGTLVLDAVYRPVKTPLLAAAVAKGCTAVPGAEWFVRQAAAQFQLFTQTPPDEALLRAAFENAISESR